MKKKEKQNKRIKEKEKKNRNILIKLQKNHYDFGCAARENKILLTN